MPASAGHIYVRRHLFGRETIRHRQRAELIRLQGNLLSKHGVARDQMANWHETPANLGAAGSVDLMHVGHGAIVDAVALSTVAADDVEISFGVELGTLLGR